MEKNILGSININTIKQKFDAAFENQKKGNFKIAEKIYKDILEIYPNHFQSIGLLGVLSLQKKDFQQAKQFFDRVLKIKPDHADTKKNLALVYEETNKLKEAKSCYEEVIKINPRDAEAYNNLGTIFNKLGDLYKAKNCYDEAIKLMPSLAEAHNNLGLKFKELGDRTKAINCFEKAIKYKPENLSYYFNLSELKKEILEPSLINNVTKIISRKSETKKNIAYGNYLLARYQRKIKNYEQEINLLIIAHSNYFESKKEKYTKEINYWFNILPKIQNFNKK